MAIKFTCTCGKKLKAPDSLRGKHAQCPHCGQTIFVGGPTEAEVADWIGKPTAAKLGTADPPPLPAGWKEPALGASPPQSVGINNSPVAMIVVFFASIILVIVLACANGYAQDLPEVIALLPGGLIRLVLVLGAYLFILCAYFAPTIVACYRHHHNAMAIAILNLLLGWTFVGWVAALVWACTKPPAALGVASGGMESPTARIRSPGVSA